MLAPSKIRGVGEHSESTSFGANWGGRPSYLEHRKESVYNMAETWETTWLRFPPVNWWRIFWFNLAIPRHAFILWLAMQDSLVTWEKMMRWGYGGNVKCVFCKGCIEGRQHLFSHVD